jgi:hypothetical protein
MTRRKWKPVEWQIGRDENAQGPFRPRPIALPDSAVSGDPGIETSSPSPDRGRSSSSEPKGFDRGAVCRFLGGRPRGRGRLAFRLSHGFAWSFAFRREAPPRLDGQLNEIPDLIMSPTDPRRDQMGRPLQRPLSGPLPAGTPLRVHKLGGSDAAEKHSSARNSRSISSSP